MKQKFQYAIELRLVIWRYNNIQLIINNKSNVGQSVSCASLFNGKFDSGRILLMNHDQQDVQSFADGNLQHEQDGNPLSNSMACSWDGITVVSCHMDKPPLREASINKQLNWLWRISKNSH